MTQSFRILAVALACVSCAVNSADAADANDAGQVIRLSPEQIAEIEAEALRREMGELGADQTRSNRIHGSASVMVGTGGSFGVAGSMAAPLGESAGAAVSFSYERFPKVRRR